MPFGITPLHVILVLIVALIILGPGRLPKVGSAVGRSIREFRHAVPATKDAFTSEVTTAAPTTPSTGTGAAAGSKVGSVAGRSIRGFRDALTETKDAFQAEVSGPPASSAPPAVTALPTPTPTPVSDPAVSEAAPPPVH